MLFLEEWGNIAITVGWSFRAQNYRFSDEKHPGHMPYIQNQKIFTRYKADVAKEIKVEIMDYFQFDVGCNLFFYSSKTKVWKEFCVFQESKKAESFCLLQLLEFFYLGQCDGTWWRMKTCQRPWDIHLPESLCKEGKFSLAYFLKWQLLNASSWNLISIALNSNTYTISIGNLMQPRNYRCWITVLWDKTPLFGCSTYFYLNYPND